MVNAQAWLDQWYPKEGGCLREEIEDEYRKINNFGKTRSEITELNISEKDLEGELKLEGFVNLKNLICEENKLTSLKIVDSPKLEILSCVKNELNNLDISACPNLVSLWCYGNLLIALDLNQNERLEDLNISDNNFYQDLFFLSHLVNLHRLGMGNIMYWENVNPSIYNRFSGSLEPLKDLTQLKTLEITNTDIESGLEYLPTSLKTFTCVTDKRKDAKAKTLEVELKKYGEEGENEELIHLLQAWRKANCELVFDTLQKMVTELKAEITKLKEELQVDKEEFEKALEKSQEWRERQLKEVTEKKDEKITNLNEKLIQLESTLSTTKTLLVTAQNLASNQTKTEENLSGIKVVMIGGFFILTGLQILFGVWILWGNKKSKKT